jgi:hypothetical protein
MSLKRSLTVLRNTLDEEQEEEQEEEINEARSEGS